MGLFRYSTVTGDKSRRNNLEFKMYSFLTTILTTFMQRQAFPTEAVR